MSLEWWQNESPVLPAKQRNANVAKRRGLLGRFYLNGFKSRKVPKCLEKQKHRSVLSFRGMHMWRCHGGLGKP